MDTRFLQKKEHRTMGATKLKTDTKLKATIYDDQASQSPQNSLGSTSVLPP
jgi:hypothetical protein